MPNPTELDSLMLSDLLAELDHLEERRAEILEDLDTCPCCPDEELDRINTRIEELIGLIEAGS